MVRAWMPEKYKEKMEFRFDSDGDPTKLTDQQRPLLFLCRVQDQRFLLPLSTIARGTNRRANHTTSAEPTPVALTVCTSCTNRTYVFSEC